MPMPWSSDIPGLYLRCTWPGSQRRRPAPQRADADAFARLRYTPGISPASCRAETSAGMRKLKPCLQPPSAPPAPAPPRRETRDELKPPAAFRVAAHRTQLRRPRPGAVGDLDPDDAVPGDDRDRDRLPGSTRPAVPDTVAEDLADQQDSRVSARVPGAEHLRDKCAGGPRPFRPPGKRHALPDSPPSHHRTRPSLAAPPRETGRAAGGRREMHAQLRPERQAVHRASADPVRGLVRACGPRPWPSVQSRRFPAPLPGSDFRPLCVRGHRNMTVHSATRRHTPGQRRNAPPARDIAASGAFSQRVAGVGFEPT
jgi:hypothetical protein